jgi:hypothetical protein
VPAFICLLTRAIPLKLTLEESVPLKDVLTVPLSTSGTLLGIGNKATPTAAKLAPYLPVLTRLFDAAQKMLINFLAVHSSRDLVCEDIEFAVNGEQRRFLSL